MNELNKKIENEELRTMESIRNFLDTLSCEHELKILTDPFVLECYSTDIGKIVKRKPIAVALPKNSEEVSILLKFCHEHNVPVTLRGGATTIGGEAVANNSILLDTKSLNKIISIDKKNKIVHAEAGVSWLELYDNLKKEDLTFKVAPSSATCTIGGAISVGGLDNHSFICGSSADQVDEVEVVLADGTIRVCNSEKNSEIFKHILYGNGLIGVITKVKIGVKQLDREPAARLYFYDNRRKAFEDYFKVVDEDKTHGVVYLEVKKQPMLRVESDEEIVGLKGECMVKLKLENFYPKYARFMYATRIGNESFPYLLRHSPVSFNFIDIVYAQRDNIYGFFEYSDKLLKNVKTLSNLRLTLAYKVIEDARSRPFIPLPSNFEKGDFAFGSYFGAQHLTKYYELYQREFNNKMIERTIEEKGLLYKYCGHVKQYAEKLLGEERWAHLVEIKQKYDPYNILNRGVLFE